MHAAPVFALLRSFSWQELRQHPWRNLAAVMAVMLGVALAFSVHLINASALSEFSSAVRSVNGEPDLELRAVRQGFDEQLYARVARHPGVQAAVPVLEIQTQMLTAQGARKPLRVLGIDALQVADVAPALLPQAAAGADRFAWFAPDTVFLNAAARALLAGDAPQLQVQAGLQLHTLAIAGGVGAGGAPLAVMDIAAAQDRFGRLGVLSRIDLRLVPGTDRAALLRELALPADVSATVPGESQQRISNLSRAYRVNLTVLALVALFTGAFLVFSVLSLSVTRRARQLALLGVMGLTSRQRLTLVLAESAVLGAAGSALGVALGGALALLALSLLQGDLGGGYFAGVAPTLQWSTPAALLYGALGVVASLVGGWWPARAAQALPLAQTLKGLGASVPASRAALWSLGLLVVGGVLALMPPILGLPLAAYVSVALLLVGGIAALPFGVRLLYDRIAPAFVHRPLAMLGVERARRVRESAAVAVSGVVASLSLAVALTLMVARVRDSVTRWLAVVLPADLYVRTAASGSGNTAAGTASDASYLEPAFVRRVAEVPGIARIEALRTVPLLLDAQRPAMALIARTLDKPEGTLPLIGEVLRLDASSPGGAAPNTIPIYVSEAVVDLYGARVGEAFAPLAAVFGQPAQTSTPPPRFVVAGVWRDYARQSGSIQIDRRHYERLSGDTRINDLALWLHSDADAGRVEAALRSMTAPGLLEFASAREIRAVSLRIFDRSFAVTYWLQAVAIAIGLFGVAANFSAQALSRRKEFGLLAHLGLTRRQILTVVAAEGAAWTVIGSITGLLLGVAVSTVLVHVINPQSFHWTMDMVLPAGRLALLCAAVVVAGTVTAWLAGRTAASGDAVLAVKEDW
ncbi:MAG: FtsX-like permease family protein [Burkholderiaceae bacterium]